MSAQILLYLTTDSLRWFRLRGGEAQPEARFAADQEGLAQFQARLAAAPREQLFALLIDIADEGFTAESVPHIRGRDRDAMLARKLAQHFYGSPFSAYLSLGRERQGRRDERVLFTAITRPAQIEAWVSALVAAKVRVRGIHTVALLLDRMMARAQLPARAFLLLNYTPAGLRQTYFSDGRLRFSRLAGAHDLAFPAQLRESAEEVRKTLGYLAAQRLNRRGERVQIVAMVGTAQFEQLRSVLEGTVDATLSLADIDQLSRSYGGRAALARSDSLAPLLQALVAEGGCAQIGGAEPLREQRRHQARLGLHAATAACVLAGLIAGGMVFVETAAIRLERDELRALEASERARLDALNARLPGLPAPAAELQSLIAEIDRLEGPVAGPAEVFAPLSAVLDRYPEIGLERLVWRLREAREAPASGAVASATLTLPATLTGDRRGLLELSQRFVEELAVLVGGQARITRRAVDLQSSHTIRGREGDPAGATATPSFELEFEPGGGRRS